MPYIDKVKREAADYYLDDLLGYIENNKELIVAGDLNYMFTKIVDQYLVVNGLNYQNINNALGALEGAKLEAYRRVAAPYENKKAELNGDVYSEQNL